MVLCERDARLILLSEPSKDVQSSDIYSIGTFVTIDDVTNLPNGKVGVFLKGHRRSVSPHHGLQITLNLLTIES